jgi:hypothetical protein
LPDLVQHRLKHLLKVKKGNFMTPLATCPTCHIGWRGPSAHDKGGQHEDETGHVVWYDQDDDTYEEDIGPCPLVWECGCSNDELFDLEMQELTDVSLVWVPVHDYGGGRYNLTIRSNEEQRTIWASPEQMKTIQEAINAEMAADSVRSDVFDWINYCWPDVLEIIEMDPSDERQECWRDHRWQEIVDKWGRLCHPQDSTALLPVEYCLKLGIAEGSTDAEAITFIEAHLDKGYETDQDEDETEADREAQRESLSKLEKLKTIQAGEEFDYQSLLDEHRWPAKRILRERGLRFRTRDDKTFITTARPGSGMALSSGGQ